MVPEQPDKHRHLHQNQTISNTYDNHQINDKNFATKAKRHQTTDKLGLQVINIDRTMKVHLVF